MMGKALWVIGAGASYHLGMPLLAQFQAFFTELWTKFPENQQDTEFQQTLPRSLELLTQHADKNVEDLLSTTSPLADEDKYILKRAIRRGFQRRNLGRIHKVFGRHGKLGPYSHLLCLMQQGDVVVSFNYDNALETPLCLVSGDVSVLDTSELVAAQLNYLTSDRARNRWIPDSCLPSLSAMRLEYAPTNVFDSGTSTTWGNGDTHVPLIKVHGSVNWTLHGDQIVVGNAPASPSVPLLVYPESAKPELVNVPHRSLIEESIAALNNCDAVVIIGYSFPQSDSVGHPFVSKLASEMSSKRVLVVDPFPSDMLSSLVGSDNVLAARFEEAVEPDSSGESILKHEVDQRR